ncbi:hypothetical protein BDV93DRAFT_555310 [Ceratobasidium sp. AG-I]|nr:hypothetical protein BDV93DRAFT_555310 [Ceratobasidium sp. AG-I]
MAEAHCRQRQRAIMADEYAITRLENLIDENGLRSQASSNTWGDRALVTRKGQKCLAIIQEGRWGQLAKKLSKLTGNGILTFVIQYVVAALSGGML